MSEPITIRPASGKLGVLLPGMGAVTTTFIAGRRCGLPRFERRLRYDVGKHGHHELGLPLVVGDLLFVRECPHLSLFPRIADESSVGLAASKYHFCSCHLESPNQWLVVNSATVDPL